jgi:hypothetical protein
MNNQAKIKLEKIKKLKLPEKVRATADKIEKGLSSADAATQKKAEDALNKLYDQIKAVAAKQREEKTEKEVNEKTIVPQNADIAAPEAKKELTKKTSQFDEAIDKALKNDPELAGFGRSDKRRDAGRKALPAGRRVARKGWSNQFGKSDGGRVYYENRENRKDRKSPAYKQGYPFLAKGGKIHPMDDEDGTFYVNLYKTKGDQIVSVDEREYNSKASAMTYAMMKRDFMTVGESIFVMNDDGDVLYTSIGTRKMAMGGKFPYQNAQVGDSARVILENKMGTIMVTYGRRFHLKFPDGTEKTYSAEELEFYPDDNMMAEGGNTIKGKSVVEFISNAAILVVFGEEEAEIRVEKGDKIYAYVDYINKEENYADISGFSLLDILQFNEDGKFERTLEAQDFGKYIPYSSVSTFKNANNKNGVAMSVDLDLIKIGDKYANGGMMAKGGEIYKIQAKYKFALQPKWEDEKFQTGGRYFLSFKQAQDFKKRLQGQSSSFEYKVVKVEEKMADGGYMAEDENYEYVNTFKRFDSNVPVPQDDFEKLVDAYHKQLSGDKLAVSKYKVLKLQMGNYLGHKTVEEMEAYIEKTHNAHKMAKGGQLDSGVYKIGKPIKVSPNLYEQKIVEIFDNGDIATASDYGRKLTDFRSLKYPIITKEQLDSQYKMAKGGYVSKRDIEAITIVNPNKSNSKNNYLTFRSGEFLNGLNQFVKGGKLTDNYTYIKRSDIFAVYYKDKAKKYNSIMESKPKNGFWVSKKALIREGGKTQSAANAPFDAYESYDEFAKLNYKVWDKLKIESGSEIYASDSLQKKLAVEYPNSGIDAKFKSLKAIQRKKVAEIMTDKNEHSLRNYLTLRGYLGQKEYDSYARLYEPKRPYVLNPANYKNYTADKVKVGSVLTSNTGVKLKVVEYNPQFGVKVLRLDATAADKPTQYIKLSKFNGLEEMASGGSIGFESLSKKVAARYEGKNVKAKFQKQYGKTYDKAEAKEVGDKVAGKVYFLQQRKMAEGGKMQGYNDRLDESLSERNNKISKMNASFKARRDESKGEKKSVSKRAYSAVKTMDKMAAGGKFELPHQLDKYFTKPAGTIEIEMSNLIPIRARKEGIENAEMYMKKAYDGEMSKRKPIEIYKTRNKKYRINDGNSTYAVAKKNGWETIYATVVSNPNVTKRAEKSTFTIAKEIRKAGESWSDAVKRVKENRK